MKNEVEYIIKALTSLSFYLIITDGGNNLYRSKKGLCGLLKNYIRFAEKLYAVPRKFIYG